MTDKRIERARLWRVPFEWALVAGVVFSVGFAALVFLVVVVIVPTLSLGDRPVGIAPSVFYNHRQWDFDGVKLSGRISAGEATFIRGWIEDHRAAQGVSFRVSGRVIDPRQLSVEDLIREFRDPGEPRPPDADSDDSLIWIPALGASLSTGLAIAVHGDEVREFRLFAIESTADGLLEIRTDLSGSWVSFPLDEDEAELLFGRPDFVSNSLRH